MRKILTFFYALLLVGAAGTTTAGAQAGKPTLAVFVVGMDNATLGDNLATLIGNDLNRSSRYSVLPSTNGAVARKLAELRAQDASSIDRNALAEWGRANGVSAICLVADAIKGNDHLFSAQLIDTKDSKLSGKGNYIRTGVGSSELSRVSLALSQQLSGSGRKRNAFAPTRTYPAELDIEMVFVEGGTFQMGCDDVKDGDCEDREKPIHTVRVSNFYISKYEITQAQWILVMSNNPTTPANQSDNQMPVYAPYNDITGDDGFFKRLYALTGKQYSLPTEAQFEYAARGGNKSQGYCYSGSNELNEVGWNYNHDRTLHPVGTKNPNELGIYDMSGNAIEWCYDWLVPNYYSQSPTQDPQGPEIGLNRAMRGGSYAHVPYHHRCCARTSSADPTTPAAGFHVVLNLK
jgi:formylglycine-generating enzyme required for sulfatase activity